MTTLPPGTPDRLSRDVIGPAPWDRFNWSGSLISVDGTDASDFTRGDVAALVAVGVAGSADYWGDTAAIIRLNDGRFVSWTCSEDVTGSGFECDAYGGDADIYFSATAEVAARALGERAAECLKWEPT